MSGQTKLDIEAVEDKLDEHRESLGLIKFSVANAEASFIMTRQQISIMTDKERAMYAFSICQHSVQMKMRENRHLGIINWLEALLNKLTAQEAHNYYNDKDIKYTKFQDQRETVIANNDYGRAIAKHLREHRLKYDDIKDLSMHINFMGRALKDVKDEKR
jgi:hypothetical protein